MPVNVRWHENWLVFSHSSYNSGFLFKHLVHTVNREYLAPQIRSKNNRFHSEAKLPWSYNYTLANHIATNKSFANREMPLFSRLYPSFGYFQKIFPPRGLKYSLLHLDERLYMYVLAEMFVFGQLTCI